MGSRHLYDGLLHHCRRDELVAFFLQEAEALCLLLRAAHGGERHAPRGRGPARGATLGANSARSSSIALPTRVPRW